MDRFLFPRHWRARRRPAAAALLVASSNFDLHYDTETGARSSRSTRASTPPRGRLGRPAGGALVKLGAGAIGCELRRPGGGGRAGQLPGPGRRGGPRPSSPSRYTRSSTHPGRRRRLGGAVPGGRPLPARPRPGPARPGTPRRGLPRRRDARSRSSSATCARRRLGSVGGRDRLAVGVRPRRSRPAASADLRAGHPDRSATWPTTRLTDRLYAVGRFAGLTAPLFILELADLQAEADRLPDAAGCRPSISSPRWRGAELSRHRALQPAAGDARGAPTSRPASTTRPGRRRLGGRPCFDVGGALLVVDLQEGVAGEPCARVLRVVPLGLGAGPGAGPAGAPGAGRPGGGAQLGRRHPPGLRRRDRGGGPGGHRSTRTTGAPGGRAGPVGAAAATSSDRGDRGAGLRRLLPRVDGERPARSPGRPRLGRPAPPLRRSRWPGQPLRIGSPNQ